MENKVKEEILKLRDGFDNELFKLYIDKLEENSTYYVLLSKMLLNQKEENEYLRKKQVKATLMLLDEGLSKTLQSLNTCDKYEKITYQNDLKIISEYLISAYLDEAYLPTYLHDVSKSFEGQVAKNNKKALTYLDSYFKDVALFNVLYIIFNYQGTFKKKDLKKVKEGILALKSKTIETDEYNDTLSIIAGELITKGEDNKYADILCSFVERSGGSEKALYFKAYIKKESDEFNAYIEKYIEMCKNKNTDVLDPFEIIK